MFSLKDRRYAVFGVANELSICFAIAKAIKEADGDVLLVSHPDIVKRGKIQPLAQSIGIDQVFECDVRDDESISACFFRMRESVGSVHGLVHGIAAAKKKNMRGPFYETSREDFQNALDVSCFSLITLVEHGHRILPDFGSIVTLTFEASRAAYPNYNVMSIAKAALEATVRQLALDLGEKNIRVNAIAASPENTLAARGVRGALNIGHFAESLSPMGRRASLEEIARMSVVLLSDVASAMTGQTIFVDCGASAVRMPPERNFSLLAKLTKEE